MASKRSLVLTLDAFGTLFRPRESVFKQYADAGRRHGLSGFSDEQVEKNFKLGRCMPHDSFAPPVHWGS